jgi:spoIIIJ-associated protein
MAWPWAAGFGWAGPKPRRCENQEEKVVAVTGDDNSGGPAPTDSSVTGGTIAADDSAAPEAETAERDEDVSERNIVDESAGDVDAESADEAMLADEAALADEPASADEAGSADEPLSAADLEQESEIAADYIEGLLDVADLDGDIDMDVEGDRPVVSVVGATLTELVGPRGEVLEALQELTRLAVHRQTGARSRIMLDVGGYRARRRQELAELGRKVAEEVGRTGVPQRLDAMTPFERKVVHDAVAAAGLRSESEGEEPSRRVVVLPVEEAVAVMEPRG